MWGQMKILAITDSLGLPRRNASVSEEDTYLDLLAKEHRVKDLSYGGLTVKDHRLLSTNVLPYFADGWFDLGIVQLGIVDCAPRPFPRCVGRYIPRELAYALRPYIQRIYYWQYTPIKAFRFYYFELIKAMRRVCKEVITIPILPARRWTEKRSPGLSKEIRRYNQIIEDTGCDTVLSCCEAANIDTTLDLHLTKEGHKQIYYALCIQLAKVKGVVL